jgi:hypothetical protein
MRSALRSLRSPAVVISILALVAGITGAAVAGPTASTSKLSKKDKKQVRSIADAEITKLAPTLSVKSATSANSVGANGVTQPSLKSTFVVTLDFPSVAAQSCDTLDVAALDSVGANDAMIATPDGNKPFNMSLNWGQLTPFGTQSGGYFDLCNPTAGAINPPPFNVRVNVIAP